MKRKILTALMAVALTLGVLVPALPASASDGRYDNYRWRNDYRRDYDRYDHRDHYRRDHYRRDHRRVVYDRDYYRHRGYQTGFINLRDGKLLFCDEARGWRGLGNDVLICFELDR